MKLKVARYITALLIVLSTNSVLALEYDAQPMGGIDCDGSGAVWASYVNSNWDVFYANLSNNDQKPITEDSFQQINPSIWGNKIVWQDDRDGSQEIYLRRLSDTSEEKISALPGDNVEPIIRGSYVVWINEKDGYRNLVVYDLSAKTQEIVTDQISVYGLDFDGEYAVWADSRKGNFDIYYYDIEKDREGRATFYSGDELYPKVSEGKIVFSLEYEGTRNIHEYDIAAREESKLTAGEEDNDILAFSDGQLIMKKGNDVFLKDTSTTVEREMAMTGYVLPQSAFLSGDSVIWIARNGIETENLDAALERAEERPLGYVPQISLVPEVSDTNVAIVYKEYVIKAVKGQDIRYDLESERIRLSVNGADILSNGELKIIESESLVNVQGFRAMSKTYQLAAPDKVVRNRSAAFTVNYINYAEGANIRIYQVDGNPTALKIIRDRENNSISAVLDNNAKVSAMIFTKQYNDILNHWAKQYIKEAAAQQIINGYQDGTIRPNNNITRAEFVKILVNTFAGETQSPAGKTGFTDSVGHWAEKELKIAQEQGWLTGYDGKSFPDNPITREEMITILMRIPGIDIKNSDTLIAQFQDDTSISDWSQEAFQKAVTEGIIQGSNGKAMPKANATRAESITMIYRYLDHRNMI